MMITTGLPATIVGVANYAMISDNPHQAHWLDKNEPALLMQAIGHQEKPKHTIKDGLRSFWT